MKKKEKLIISKVKEMYDKGNLSTFYVEELMKLFLCGTYVKNKRNIEAIKELFILKLLFSTKDSKEISYDYQFFTSRNNDNFVQLDIDKNGLIKDLIVG